MNAANLVGSWKLRLIQVEAADTGLRTDLYGPHPVGRLIIAANGRLNAVITAGGRAPPKEDSDGATLFKSMMAYSGRYRIEGDKFITSVDTAWHPGWVATEQVRFFTLVDDVLSIRSALQTHPNFPGQQLYGIIEWQREG